MEVPALQTSILAIGGNHGKESGSFTLEKHSRRKQCSPASRKIVCTALVSHAQNSGHIQPDCHHLNERSLNQQSENANNTMGRGWEKAVLTVDRRQDGKERVCESKNCRDISAFSLTTPLLDQDEDLNGKPEVIIRHFGSHQADKGRCQKHSIVEDLQHHLLVNGCKHNSSSSLESDCCRSLNLVGEGMAHWQTGSHAFMCMVCNKHFQRKPALDQHMFVDASVLNKVMSMTPPLKLPDRFCQTVVEELAKSVDIDGVKNTYGSSAKTKSDKELHVGDSDDEREVHSDEEDEIALIEEEEFADKESRENEGVLEELFNDDDEEEDEETLAEDEENILNNENEVNEYNTSSESTDNRELDEDVDSEPEHIQMIPKPFLSSCLAEAAGSNDDDITLLSSADDTTVSSLSNEPSSVTQICHTSVSRRKANRPKPVKIRRSPLLIAGLISSAAKAEQSTLQVPAEGASCSPRMCWCSMCGQALLSKELLAAHVAEHEKFFPFFCALCDANFMEGQLLKIHVATKHTVEHSLQCQTCGMYFKQRGSLSTHMKYCRQAPACVVCAVRFPNGDELEKHYYTHSEEERAAAETLACIDCGEIFLSTIQLKEHMKTHGELRPYWCDLCGATFTQQRSLDKHRQLHRRQQDCRCEICGVQLLTRSGYIAHKRAHRNIGMIQVGLGDQVEKVILDKNSQSLGVKEEKKEKTGEIDAHKYFKIIEQELSKTVDSASLSVVARKAPDGSNGRMHNKVHVCPFCPLTCSSADRLQTHIRRLHREAKLEQCEVCSRRFYGAEYMERHKRSHANLSDMFPCDQCSKVFKRKWSLETHRKIHSFRKFVNCDICGEEFRFLSEVEKHKNRKHQYDKTQVSYECNVCHMKFATLSHLSIHSSHSHCTADGNPFKCVECQETFLTCTDLKKHIYQKHEDELHIPIIKPEPPDSYEDSCSLLSGLDSLKQPKNFQGDGLCDKAKSGSEQNETAIAADGKNTVKQILPNVGPANFKSNDANGSSRPALGVEAYNELTRQSMLQARLHKRFACEMCFKCFSTKSDLRTHMRTHTGETPYKCDYCDRAFKQRGHRKLHIQVAHTRDMPYTCQLCGQAYPTRYRYQIHLKRHSGIKEHECQFCDKAYYTVGKLNEHKRRHHAKEMGQ